jgi:hypothetical protein
MSAITIEKNIPVPSSTGRGRPGKWVSIAAQMEVGDSVLDPTYVKKKASHGLTMALRKLGHKTATRPEGDGLRIWRVE